MKRFWCAFVLIVLIASPVWAHDPFDITSRVFVRSDGVEVQITLAWSTTLLLLANGERPVRWWPPEKFEEVRPIIESRAPRFVALTGGGRPLECDRVKATLKQDENDVIISLQFRPAPESGFRFEAVLLRILVSEGYTVRVIAIGPKEGDLMQASLTIEEIACEVKLAPNEKPSVKR